MTDITYIPTEEGFIYLAGHKDIYTKEVVGYAMDSRMGMELVSKSLCRAKAKKAPDDGLIHHSDRGRQYCSYETHMSLRLIKKDENNNRANILYMAKAMFLPLTMIINHCQGFLRTTW